MLATKLSKTERITAGKKEGTTVGQNSTAEGQETTASGKFGAHAEGYKTVASGDMSHAEGNNTTASGESSHAEGRGTMASGSISHAGGDSTIAATWAQTAIGRFNIKDNAGITKLSNWFIIGNGGSDEARSNAFRVANDGTTFGKGAFQTSGADYAEYFEWLDGNPKAEDRRGYFVTLDGNKIRKATTADTYILGIVSATPVVVGNSDPDDWHGRFLRDVFGNYLKEMIEEEYEDENGEKQKRMIESYVVNPEFDSSKSYTPRAKRQEWSPVGMLGQLIVRDDGTCEVNGYCCPNDDGIATMSQAGYRVIKRVTEDIIQVIFYPTKINHKF